MKRLLRIFKFIKLAPLLVEFMEASMAYLEDKNLTQDEVNDLYEKGAALKSQIEDIL